MDFLSTLTLHLESVRNRDLETLVTTLPKDGWLTLIMPQGQIKHEVAEFREFHESWFADPDWSLSHEVLSAREDGESGFAVIRSHYKDVDQNGAPYEMKMIVSLVFLRSATDGWVLRHDQNTILP